MRTDPYRLIGRTMVAAVLTLLPAACNAPQVVNPAPLATVAATPSTYAIQPGDEIELKFFFNPELNERLFVRPDGAVSLQLVGEQRVAGRTPKEVERQLRQAYDHELKQSDLAVIVRGFGSQRAFVDGEVGTPAVVDIMGGMTVMQAVTKVGGFKTTARRQVILIRRSGGQPQATVVDLDQVLNGTDMAKDIPLQPYDIVFVPRSGIADVNLWVDQYLRQNIPIPLGFGYTLH